MMEVSLPSRKKRRIGYKHSDLFDAINMNNYNCVKHIAFSGMNLNVHFAFPVFRRSPAQSSTDFQTPLYASIWANHLEITELLLEKGARVNEICFNCKGVQERPLSIAAQLKRFQIVQVLLNIPGINIDYTDGLGFSALYHAVYNLDVEMTTLLLDHNADINAGINFVHDRRSNYVDRSLDDVIDIIDLLLQRGCTYGHFSYYKITSYNLFLYARRRKSQRIIHFINNAPPGAFREPDAHRTELSLQIFKRFGKSVSKFLKVPLSLKDIILISVRKTIARQQRNVRKEHLQGLNIPQTLKDELWTFK